MSLEFYPPLPVPPTREEMEQAIEHFAHEFYSAFSDGEAMPADVPLLQLAERLAAVREAAQNRFYARSGPAIEEMATDSHESRGDTSEPENDAVHPYCPDSPLPEGRQALVDAWFGGPT